MKTPLFSGDCLYAEPLDGGIVEVRCDRKGDPVNKLDSAFIDELRTLLGVLGGHPGLQGVLLGSAKDAFLAGADIAVLWSMFGWPPERLIAFCADMHRVLGQLSNLPVPVACAINGYALGGGLEVALCADYRILATDGQVGFPEVGLGILPAAGGTVRTPRLTDAATALEWLVGSLTYKSAAALKAGMVDAVVEPAHLRRAALDWLHLAAAGGSEWKMRRERGRTAFAADVAAFAAARALAQKAALHNPAGLAVIDLLERCAPLSREAAQQMEAETFAKLMQTPTARAMTGIFLAGQHLRKRNKTQAAAAPRIRRAAVLGAGIMGGGIAYSSAAKGIPVLLKDIARSALDLGIGEARKLLAKQVEGGRFSPEQAESVLASIRPMLEFEDFDSVDIVVEAVVESLKIKQEVFKEVEVRVRPGTVLASNTSSLAIADIAAPLQRPQDLVGMHFFNPVPLMPLVEIVRGPQTGDAAVATALAYAVGMGKTPLVVKDCPGFLVNRLLGAYFTAFLLLIRDGANFVAIDRVMETWGWPMGPSYLLDVAGLDTLDKALTILARAYPAVMGTDFETAIQRLAGAGRYGQKSGAGFFRYEADARGKPRRSGDPATYELLARVQQQGGRSFPDAEVLDRMMLAMILEAGRCLDEQVAESVADVDTSMRLGTGFPAHHGGPLWYADSLGLCEILRRCESYRPLGGLYEAGRGIRELAGRDSRYYGSFVP
jgi:3-hydroxyacyl-CoA dehydrogenase/enoyl-CoA hydratase/3-hydroxybutyryl-CoA epimerase/enoyl-CoA isomerase